MVILTLICWIQNLMLIVISVSACIKIKRPRCWLKHWLKEIYSILKITPIPWELRCIGNIAWLSLTLLMSIQQGAAKYRWQLRVQSTQHALGAMTMRINVLRNHTGCNSRCSSTHNINYIIPISNSQYFIASTVLIVIAWNLFRIKF